MELFWWGSGVDGTDRETLSPAVRCLMDSQVFSRDDGAAGLAVELTDHSPRRQLDPGHPGQRVHVESSLRYSSGQVRPGWSARSESPGERRAQEEMATAVHRWSGAGIPAVIEVPTDTGKCKAIASGLGPTLPLTSGAVLVMPQGSQQARLNAARCPCRHVRPTRDSPRNVRQRRNRVDVLSACRGGTA